MGIKLILDIIVGITAILALIFTGLSYLKDKKQAQLNIFNEFMKQLTDEDARKDRKLVRQIILSKNKDENRAVVKNLLEKMRSDPKDTDGQLGAAVERTIVKFDRVGFFLISDTPKPIMKPPIWLWPLIDTMWEKLEQFIEYRRVEEPEGHFAYYFEKLAKLPKTKRKVAK